MPANNGLTVTDTHSLVKGVAAAVLAALIVATLYFGRDVFVPVALSILLSFVLAPLVHALQNFRVPRAISVIGVVLLAFSIIFVIGGVIATQMTQLAGELPRYESNMRAKIQSLRGTAAANNTLERAADVLQDLSKELNKPKEPSSAMLSSAVGGGCLTSTGIGLASCPAKELAVGAADGSFGLLSSLPRS